MLIRCRIIAPYRFNLQYDHTECDSSSQDGTVCRSSGHTRTITHAGPIEVPDIVVARGSVGYQIREKSRLRSPAAEPEDHSNAFEDENGDPVEHMCCIAG